MQHLRESMDKVLREKGLASHVDRFMTVIQGVESQMARLSDVAEEANTKAQKSVSKTEAGRMIKSALMDMGGAAQNLDVNKLPVTIQLENGTTYTLLRRAGVGGFGTVFVAQDTEMDLVAFKVCEDQGETDRGDREAQIMQKLIKLKHPNIAAFLSNSKFQGKLIIVMELVKGDSLDNILAKEVWTTFRPAHSRAEPPEHRGITPGS
ncbi:hypothetical protein T484DRAFT_3186921 [Baffinella frigidus]|nr:hypothetical protein T484DRAFT_3499302 [Cryptophyta sp. CCMP2293]KAJ1475331.1 hypothetical protein T484DRAFT_3186921 [Cryptophyta sp. CCMP2293]